MISEHAIIDPSASIGKDVKIGPFTVIGADVSVGDNTYIAPHVVIKGHTTIGKNNTFYQFSSIGEDCQDKKYNGEKTSLIIGNNNIFREGCTVHRGTEDGGGVTKIGNNNLLMVNSHIAHDCILEDHIIFANNASVAGHVTVGEYASLGGFVGVHQFCAIGAHSFAAGGTIVFKDIAPFVTVSGYPAQTHGLNTVGLERRNFSREVLQALKKAYKIIFRQSRTVTEALKNLSPLIEHCKEVELFTTFIQKSSRGIIR